MSLNVRVITPEKVFLSSEADQVVLPSITGEVGILTGHAPLVTVLGAGVLRHQSNGSWTTTVIYGGFAEVENNQVTVLVNGAEATSDTNGLPELEKAYIEATEKLEKLKEAESDRRQLKPVVVEVSIAKARLDAIELSKNNR